VILAITRVASVRKSSADTCAMCLVGWTNSAANCSQCSSWPATDSLWRGERPTRPGHRIGPACGRWLEKLRSLLENDSPGEQKASHGAARARLHHEGDPT
jgi:hypothetical protein